ncbi:Hsp33 family molecular chaperone HslO [Crassaminicella profunda]|uniref:Hsp33 family molecular chaperone HslO n=1 Tax=Crassaminicella profunda TaxID=1286698 RepID=UPI001CA72CCE|nr:Hsp33 family molecular chaperone HslO [Crassaminicella profunda]QZY56280.1 Hsp33 family molecular chaperone HslO [Crassaminicella profunda]
MKNYVIRAVAANKNLRVFFAVTTGLVEEARKIHDTTPVVTAALGRTLTATAMMGMMLKGDRDKLSVQIKGDGPVKQILAVADPNGNVKGYVANPYVELPLRQDGKLDVGGAVGTNGKMVVIKDLGLKEPYVGQSDLVSGEIAQDFTAYFAYSEQQPSAVALGVLVDRDYSVKEAGGLIIQVLPDAEEDVIIKLEERLKNLPPITKIMETAVAEEEMLKIILEGFDFEILDKKEIKLVCDCSVEKLEKALISVGEKDLKEMIEEDGQAELTCHFCNTKYHFDKEHLLRLLEQAK